jgi:hypothetical protein
VPSQEVLTYEHPQLEPSPEQFEPFHEHAAQKFGGKNGGKNGGK